MNTNPLTFTLFENETTLPNVKENSMYSRIGFAKVIRSRTKDSLITQTGITSEANVINLIDDGQTVFIGNENIIFEEGDGN